MQALSQLSYTPERACYSSLLTTPNQATFLLLLLVVGVLPTTAFLAEWTGLEPATPGVTGRYSNQLNYHSTPCGASAGATGQTKAADLAWQPHATWRPYGDSNPGRRRERAVS